MLTLDRKQQRLGLLEHRTYRPPLLAGFLFAGLGIVPLTSAAPLTPARVLGLCFLGAVTAVLVALGLPRTRARALPPRPSDATRADDRVTRIELTGEALPIVYRAVLVFADGSRRIVLERPEPAGLLTDAAALARDLGVPLEPGFGLDERSFDELLTPSPTGVPTWAPEAPLEFDAPAFAGQRNAAFTTLWASGFVLVATVVMSEQARAKVEPSSLSLVLPCIGVFLVLVVGLWLLGLRERVKLRAASVSRARFWFDRELGVTEALDLRVTAAVVVTPEGGRLGHLVIASDRGLSSYRVWGGSPQAALLKSSLGAPVTTRAAE